MPTKHNDNSRYIKNWTTKKLKKEAIAYHEMIYKIESYGSKDMQNYIRICDELYNRKIEINTKIEFN